MNAPAALPATQDARDKVRAVRSLLEAPKVMNGIKAIVPKFITPERMLRICANAVEKNPLLAECSQTSLLSSVMVSAALGLEPNTLAGHAFLIPYKNRRNVNGRWLDVYECQFQMGYKGYIELAMRNENCVSYVGVPVFQNDRFRHFVSGDMGELTLEYEAARRERGAFDGAFSIAVYQRATGARGRASIWLPLEDVYKARAKSQTYASLVRALESAEAEGDKKKIERAQRNLAETPWVAHEPAMGAKTGVRALAKQLPIFGNLLAASEVEDRSETGVLDMEAMSSDPSLVKAVVNGEEDAPVVQQQDAPPPAQLAPPTDRPITVVTTQPAKEAVPVAEPAQNQRRKGGAQTQRAEPPPAHDPQTGEIYGDGAPPPEDDGLSFPG